MLVLASEAAQCVRKLYAFRQAPSEAYSSSL
jgi:hypothetical protein